MIYTSNFVMMCEFVNIPALYTNNLSAPGFSNINFESDLNVDGIIHGVKHMDIGSTPFARFSLNSNLSFGSGVTELHGNSNFPVNFAYSDFSGMASMPMSVSPGQVFNYSNGILTVPTSGLYNLYMQGSFSNDAANSNYTNGVYFYFKNMQQSNARVAVAMSKESHQYTSHTVFLLSNDTVHPTFFSSDSNASLIGGTGETFVGFSVMATITPQHSNYVRV